MTTRHSPIEEPAELVLVITASSMRREASPSRSGQSPST